jgi:hypothetical protein
LQNSPLDEELSLYLDGPRRENGRQKNDLAIFDRAAKVA